MSRFVVFVLCLIGTFFATITTVSAATYYVAGDTGLDTNSGTSSAPWQTIQKAANTMVAGDTVNVKGGVTYTEKVVPANSGSSGNYITYQAWDGTGLPIIDATGETDAFYAQIRTYLKINGFILKNGSTRGAYITSNTYFYNNIVENSYQGVNISSAATDTFVYNNTVISNVISGINVGSGFGSYNRVIVNNIIANNGLGLSSDSGFLTFVHDYNLYYNNTGYPGYPEFGTDYLTVNGISAAPHDVHANPLLIAPEDDSFTLQTTSPAINAGTDLTAGGVTDDILGRARPNAGAFDIGAYEDPNLYVAGDTGSDSNNGAMATPFLTIQKGADVATAGDNVNVKGGVTYNTVGSATCTLMAGERAIACIKTNSGTVSNPITYQAWAGTGTPVVDAAATNDGFGVLSSYIVISGFEIKNGSNGNNPRAIMVSNPLGAQVSYLTIKNNIIHHNNYGGIEAFAADHLKIYNNTFDSHSLAAAIRVRPLTDTVDIKNNIITNNLTGIYSTASNVTADYNVLFGNTTAYNGLSAGTHDIALDPLYVASGSNDFRLQKSSPASNVGVTVSDAATDILGVSRPQGAAYDIGAYEYYDVTTSLTALSPDPTSDSTPTFAGTSATPHGTISSVSYRVDGGSWTSSGVTGTTSFGIALSSALDDGVHTIDIRATDSNGYTTDATLYGSDSFTVDTGTPTGTATINSGALLTNTATVTMNLSATDTLTSVTHMKISESATFTGASWEAYATSKAFTLSSGDGSKTVYVKYKDAAGNESEAYSSTITLDTTKPITRITDLGLIDDVPDKTPLFYYFTSQTPRIKGTTEALSTVHFIYEENDYTTTANAWGSYEITLPELPRELVELTYYAVDPAGNQGTNRILKLMIGVENFPAELVAVVEPDIEAEETSAPIDGTVTPTPSTTPVMTVYGIQVVDAEGQTLANTSIYINGQEYRTDENGKVYLEAKPTEDMELEVEINGRRVKGSVMGEKIVAEGTVNNDGKKEMAPWSKVLLWILALTGVGYVVVRVVKRQY